MIPLNADRIDWQHERPWGGGTPDSRSVRIYYGRHSLRAAGNKYLTSPDKAWVRVDDSIPPEEYDWSWMAGHEAWLIPCGFTVSPYTRKLAKTIMDNHAHRVLIAQGYDQYVTKVIEEGEAECVDMGSVRVAARHKYLEAGQC